jgi:hypothetical protein
VTTDLSTVTPKRLDSQRWGAWCQQREDWVWLPSDAVLDHPDLGAMHAGPVRFFSRKRDVVAALAMADMHYAAQQTLPVIAAIRKLLGDEQ